LAAKSSQAVGGTWPVTAAKALGRAEGKARRRATSEGTRTLIHPLVVVHRGIDLYEKLFLLKPGECLLGIGQIITVIGIVV